MNESRHLAQLLPRSRLQSRIDVTDDGACTFSDEHDSVRFFQLRPKEPCVALGRIGMRGHEALLIEAIVCLQKQCSQSTKRKNIRIAGKPNHNVVHEWILCRICCERGGRGILK